ncbi:MAG: hypothetical protein KJZ59_01630, partial [Pararhodobacter sp.]|nr:hypothetical protein [Pararhodobacter sp.]
ARTLARYRNPTLAEIAGIYLRALSLAWRAPGLPALPAPRPERLVVTLTTIPARAHRLRTTLRSLLDQSEPADRIVLCLPRTARRGGAPYPDPATLALPAGVQVLRCTDEGPATKLLPTLRAEPGATLVVVDDDVVYPRDFLAGLLAAHRADPGAALGLRGVRVAPGVPFPALAHVMCSAIPAPVPVDILFGTWGYLLPPGVLDGAVQDFSGYPDAVRFVDDVWISGHLARRGVRRLVVPTRSFPVETPASAVQALTDGPNRSGDNDAVAIAAFARYWRGA